MHGISPYDGIAFQTTVATEDLTRIKFRNGILINKKIGDQYVRIGAGSEVWNGGRDCMAGGFRLANLIRSTHYQREYIDQSPRTLRQRLSWSIGSLGPPS